MTMTIRQDAQRERFLLFDETGAQQGELRYRVGVGRINAITVQVEPAFRGIGNAAALLQALVDYARSLGHRVIPVCPYVKHMFARYPERYADIFTPQKEKELES